MESQDQIIEEVLLLNVGGGSRKINGVTVRRIVRNLYSVQGQGTYCTLDGTVGAIERQAAA